LVDVKDKPAAVFLGNFYLGTLLSLKYCYYKENIDQETEI